MTAFEFHAVGSATLNRILGALLSTGAILAVTRQCSGTAAAPVPLAATTVAAVTVPPEVGKPIDDAGMAVLASCAQASGSTVVVLGNPADPESPPPPPPHAVSAIAMKAG
jgi:hypothetical protein